MIFNRDFVTRENHWQIASLVTQKALFLVTHALFFIPPPYSMYFIAIVVRTCKHNINKIRRWRYQGAQKTKFPTMQPYGYGANSTYPKNIR